MTHIEHNRFVPKTTAECVSLLNIHIGEGNWKRTSKFKLKRKSSEADVRVFTNGTEFVTIVVNPEDRETSMYPNLDLSKFLPLIKDIEKAAKKFYTHDYGAVHLDPFQMKLFVNAGDGGWAFSELPAKQVAQMLNNGDLHKLSEGDWTSLPGLSGIKGVEYEAECDPNTEEPEYENFIYLTDIVDFCDLDDFGEMEEY